MTLQEIKKEIVKADALLTCAKRKENKDIANVLIADASITLYMLLLELNDMTKGETNDGNKDNENDAD